MNYSKQLKKQQRKQMKLAAQQQTQQSRSAYTCAKPATSSKTLMGFVIICGFIANVMSANADATPLSIQSNTAYQVEHQAIKNESP